MFYYEGLYRRAPGVYLEVDPYLEGLPFSFLAFLVEDSIFEDTCKVEVPRLPTIHQVTGETVY